MEASPLAAPPEGARLDDTTAVIKNAVDIVEVIGEYVRLEPQGSKFKGLCPFHDDHSPSMVVDPSFRSYRCWACGAKGDVFSFVQQIERITFVEAKQRLADRVGIRLSANNNPQRDLRQSAYKALSWAQGLYHQQLFDERIGAAARAYLEQRHFSLDTARRYGLGYAPNSFEWLVGQAHRAGIDREILVKSGLVRVRDRDQGIYDAFRDRLMVPIRDERKRVLGFGGRVLPGEQAADTAKYINTSSSPVYNKSEVLYGIDVAIETLQGRKGGEKTLVVMEGYMDCLMAYQAGWTEAVAVCGTALTLQHVAKLRQFADTVVLMLDGDAAGMKAAHQATALFLNSEVNLRLCALPGGLDPCDLIVRDGAEELRRLVAQAPDVIEYLIDHVRGRYDTRAVEGRRKAIEDMLQTLAEVPALARTAHAIKFNLALNRLETAFGVSETLLRQRLTELRERRPTARVTTPPAPESEIPDDDNVPFDPREWRVVQWLVHQPGRVAAEFRALFPLAQVRHPRLRRLTEVCYGLYRQMGVQATVEVLRERLIDADLDHLLQQLLEGVPSGEKYEEGLLAIKADLLARQRRAQAAEAWNRLSPEADDQEQINTLRQLLNQRKACELGE